MFNIRPLFLSQDVLSLSHWYPGLGVVFDSIDSWSLPFFLLWLSELLCLCCVAALESLHALSFNAIIIQILKFVCTISFHYSFPWISCHIPIGILGKVWRLIVSIPDLCPFSYIYVSAISDEIYSSRHKSFTLYITNTCWHMFKIVLLFKPLPPPSAPSRTKKSL